MGDSRLKMLEAQLVMIPYYFSFLAFIIKVNETKVYMGLN